MIVAQAAGLTVAYGTECALRGVTLAVRAGERVGMLGVSGSGKTTLGRALQGRLPRAARVVEGQAGPTGRAAYIPQEPGLAFSPYLQVGGQVRDGAAGGRGAWPRERVVEMFRALGLEEGERIYGSYPHELSGGQMQRVAWAQAMAQVMGQERALIVADEATAALDAVAQREMVEVARRLVQERGVALLWISHDPYLLGAVAERLVVMERGELVEDGEAGAVLREPRAAATARLLEAAR